MDSPEPAGRRVLGILLLLTSAGCTHSNAPPPQSAIRYEGGDGTSCATAVVVLGGDAFSGIAAEYAWLDRRYPGYKKILQRLTTCNDRAADLIRIRTSEGHEVDVFFDISDFYGKLE